ncbi:MAG: histidine--tRNA ligase [Candidatus Bathyarchaeota archaeon]
MKDTDSEEMAKRIWVTDKLLAILKRYGFRMVEPSPIENLETLEAKCGSSIRDEIFWFEDKAKRKQGLRFDLTVGLARMVASHYDWPMPLKLSAVSNMWRYDEPQRGRYRCFYQWDAEIFGTSEVEADAEIIALSLDLMENMGLKDNEARINNRKFVEGFLDSLDISENEDLAAVLRVIDKFRKLSSVAIREEFNKIGLNSEKIEKILEFASIRGEPKKVLTVLSKFLTDNEKTKEGYNELSRLVGLIEAFGKISHCILDMSIVRGIGYYDGIVFEVFDKKNEDIGSIIGGGRFNNLCRIYGRDLPATGVAGGIERLMLSLEKSGVMPKISQESSVFVSAVDDSVRSKVLEIVKQLRDKGISTEFDLKKRSLTRQLEYADNSGIPYTVIIGSNEIEKGAVKLRDMKKRTEIELTLEKLFEILISNNFA